MPLSLFERTGAHVLVDGQFGSTGKGVLAAWLAREAIRQGVEIAGVVSNAGPNSGHTFYHGTDKHVLKQLPTFAVAGSLLGRIIPAYMSAGAVLDPEIIAEEAARYPNIPIVIDPSAAVVTAKDKETERSGSIAAVATTGSGTGAALARKIAREPSAVAKAWRSTLESSPNVVVNSVSDFLEPVRNAYVVEVSQGFSLGLNSEFFPKVTSRECTVMQAISDARAQLVSKVYMSIRTYPIRVGNVGEFSSGDCYPDQREMDWSDIGVEPELTTVTKRQRRIFSFSERQFLDAVKANMPDFVFANFMNYLSVEAQDDFLATLERFSTGRVFKSFSILSSTGPTSDDVAFSCAATPQVQAAE